MRFDEVELQKRQEAKAKKGTGSVQGSPAPQGGSASATPSTTETSALGTQKLAAIGSHPAASPTPAKTTVPSAGLRITIPKSRTVTNSSHTTASPQPTPSSTGQGSVSFSNCDSNSPSVPASVATHENKREAISQSQPKAAEPSQSADSSKTGTLSAPHTASTAVTLPIRPPTAPAAMLPAKPLTAPAAMLPSRPPAPPAVTLPAKPRVLSSSATPAEPAVQKALDAGQNGQDSMAATANTAVELPAATATSTAASAVAKEIALGEQRASNQQQGLQAQYPQPTTAAKPPGNDGVAGEDGQGRPASNLLAVPSNAPRKPFIPLDSLSHGPNSSRYDPAGPSATAPPPSSIGPATSSSRKPAAEAASGPAPSSAPALVSSAVPARPVNPPEPVVEAVSSL